MSTLTDVTTGNDTFITNNAQTLNFFGEKFPGVGWFGPPDRETRILLTPAIPSLIGETVTVGNLAIPIKQGWASARTIRIQLLASKVNYRKVTWLSQPAVTGTAVTLSTTAVANTPLNVNITSLLQQIAAGAPAYGFRISMDGPVSPLLLGKVYGYQSGGQQTTTGTNASSWVVSYTLSGDTTVPTDLKPAGGAIGLSRPWITWSPMDDQVSCRVQITNDLTTWIWESGEIVSDQAGMNLATQVSAISGTIYPGLANGASTNYRVGVKNSAGVWVDSDWASMTRRDYPTLTVTNPAAGELWDATSTLAASLSAGPPLWWEIAVTDAAKGVLWSSGRQTTATIAATTPADVNKVPLLRDGIAYKALFRVGDRTDRVDSPGDPGYVERYVDFVMDTDAATTAPSPVSVTQSGPSTYLTVSIASTPDRFWVELDGVGLRHFALGEWAQVGIQYTFPLHGYAAPGHPHTWRVYAVVDDKRSNPCTLTQAAWVHKGVSLVLSNGDFVTMEGPAPTWTRQDRRDTYQPIGSPVPIEILRARETPRAPLACQIDADHPDGLVEGEADVRLEVVRSLRLLPWSETVRIVADDYAKEVWIRDVLAQPADSYDGTSIRIWDVTATLVSVEAA